MYQVDARGLSCPEPVMLASEAMKAHPGEAILVLVDEPHSRANVEKFAVSQGRKVTVKPVGQEFELLIEAH